MGTLTERLTDALERLAGLPLPEDAPDFHLRNKDKTLPAGLQVYAIQRDDIRTARKLLLEARYPVAENVPPQAFVQVLRGKGPPYVEVCQLADLYVGDKVLTIETHDEITSSGTGHSKKAAEQIIAKLHKSAKTRTASTKMRKCGQ